MVVLNCGEVRLTCSVVGSRRAYKKCPMNIWKYRNCVKIEYAKCCVYIPFPSSVASAIGPGNSPVIFFFTSSVPLTT